MDIRNKIYSRNGLAVIELAKELILCKEGEKIPTIADLTDRLQISRGTIQSAFRTLEDEGTIELSNRGHMGSYLQKKDLRTLLELTGYNYIVGAMPLPYSKTYEGLATALISQLNGIGVITASLSYMRGALNRIQMLLNRRYEYVVMSAFAANLYQNKFPDRISVICSLGKNSYCSSHVCVFRDPNETEIRDGMRVGIDPDSIDQIEMTQHICGGKKVHYKKMEYSRFVEHILKGNLDAVIWNVDELIEKYPGMKYIPVQMENDADTTAVIAANSDDPVIHSILSETLDSDEINRIRQEVVSGVRIPSY